MFICSKLLRKVSSPLSILIKLTHHLFGQSLLQCMASHELAIVKFILPNFRSIEVRHHINAFKKR